MVDADAVGREVVGPGTPGLAQIAERFGPDVIATDGSLDRPALGQVVFGDPQARRDLEGITHPLIRRRSQQLFESAPDDAVVVHDVPLLVELGMGADYALTVVVDVPEEERLRRLVELRGMDEQAARSRIRAQADDEQRRAAADVSSTTPAPSTICTDASTTCGPAGSCRSASTWRTAYRDRRPGRAAPVRMNASAPGSRPRSDGRSARASNRARSTNQRCATVCAAAACSC